VDANYYSIIVILFLQNLGLKLAVTRLERGVTEKYIDEYKNSRRFVRVDAYNEHYCLRRRDVVQFGRYERTEQRAASFRA